MASGNPTSGLRAVLAVAAFLLAAAGCGGGSGAGASASGTPSGTHTLTGTFKIAAGTCASATAVPAGSYLEMLGNGNAVVKNSFGGCANPDYTPLKPGSKGGLVTGSYEPNPTPAFAGGNAVASQIIVPVSFFGTNFSISTQAVDPQSHQKVPPPSITSTGGKLSGDVSAVDAAYNTAYFNQGSPKPGGSYLGSTKPMSGTISCNGSFTVQWQSLIVGGAFNNYTGVWHLAGTFVPASGTAAQALGCS